MDRMLRPKATVLPESAVVPEQNLVQPPTEFTHEVIAEQPYYYGAPQQSAPPDGKFSAGTKVKLSVHKSGPYCEVIDGRGLRVTTALKGLRPLS